MTIWPSTFLVNDNWDEDYQLLHALNIPIGPTKYYLKKGEKFIRFTLIFPALPQSWNNFELIEITDSPDSGFKVSNIIKNESGVYHIII